MAIPVLVCCIGTTEQSAEQYGYYPHVTTMQVEEFTIGELFKDDPELEDSCYLEPTHQVMDNGYQMITVVQRDCTITFTCFRPSEE